MVLDESHMNIKVKFDIGDPVFPIVLETERTVICPDCKGSGYTSVWEDEYGKDHYKNCQKCGGGNVSHGNGIIIQKTPPCWKVYRGTLEHGPRSVSRVIVDKDETWIQTRQGNCANEFPPFPIKDCYKSAKTAQNACERRNAK